MKTKKIMIALMLLTTGTAWAEDFPKDSLKIVDIEEVVVIATPKENRKLRDLPVAATVLSQDNMRANQVNSVKNLTGIVPNLFIPDYGSKLTTSIYIRGIGSRINTPSVGLYVDNIPYIDKSAFDFNYADTNVLIFFAGHKVLSTGVTRWEGLSRYILNLLSLIKAPIFAWEQQLTIIITFHSPIITVHPTALLFLPEVSTSIQAASLRILHEITKRSTKATPEADVFVEFTYRHLI